MKRYVTRTRKDTDGDITALCKEGEWWSPRYKKDAIHDIETGLHSYWVAWPNHADTEVHVAKRNGKKYLRTDRDSTTRNNLDELPDC